MTDQTHAAMLSTLRPTIPAPPAFLLASVPQTPAHLPERRPASPTGAAALRNRLAARGAL